MKNRFVALSLVLTIILVSMSIFLVGCDEKEYELSVTGKELLYNEIDSRYDAGEEVTVKVKITPNKKTVAYLDLTPLTKVKGSQDDFYTFTFVMPEKNAVLTIKNIDGFDEDLLMGFHLNFYNKHNTPIENLNNELKSSEAIAVYYYSYLDEKYGKNVFTSNNGANVFADGKSYIGSKVNQEIYEFELERTLYFTYELLDAVAYVDWVYWDPETDKLRTEQGAGFTCGEVVSATHNSQNLFDTRYNDKGEEYQETFDSIVTVKFEYIDYLTNVKILEYDNNNQVVKSSDFTGKNPSETFMVSEACEYVVIQEEYMVMSGDKKGEKHYERTLINKSKYGDGKNLKYPRGDGLIAPTYLSIKWAESEN